MVLIRLNSEYGVRYMVREVEFEVIRCLWFFNSCALLHSGLAMI